MSGVRPSSLPSSCGWDVLMFPSPPAPSTAFSKWLIKRLAALPGVAMAVLWTKAAFLGAEGQRATFCVHQRKCSRSPLNSGTQKYPLLVCFAAGFALFYPFISCKQFQFSDFIFRVVTMEYLNCYFSPGSCGSVAWAPVCKPTGPWFDSQSGQVLRGGAWEVTTHCCFSPIISPSLKINE